MRTTMQTASRLLPSCEALPSAGRCVEKNASRRKQPGGSEGLSSNQLTKNRQCLTSSKFQRLWVCVNYLGDRIKMDG